MRTLMLALACLVVFPATALAKGPTGATIEGPGLTSPLKIDGSGSWDEGDLFPTLVEETAFFPATWGGDHSHPILRKRPLGDLGPRYRVTYRLPGPAGRVDSIRQDLYPFSRGGPLTLTPKGQPFFETRRTLGGWFRGAPRLKTMLVAAGLPISQARRASPAAAARDDAAVPLGLWALPAALAVAGIATLALRRRVRPASA